MSRATDELHAVAREATEAELVAVGRLLRGSGRTGLRPRVVLAYPGVGVGERISSLAGCTSQLAVLNLAREALERLGVEVLVLSTQDADRPQVGEMRDAHVQVDEVTAGLLPHVDTDEGRFLTRWSLVLGGVLGGTLFEDITDSAAHTRALIEVVAAKRLAAWAAVAGRAAPEHGAEVVSYPCGADSDGIVSFVADGTLVVKTTSTAVARVEVRALSRFAAVTAPGEPSLVPAVHGVLEEGERSSIVMEHLPSGTIEDDVFADERRQRVDPGVRAVLRPFVEGLGRAAGRTAVAGGPAATDYLLRRRFTVLRHHPDFLACFDALGVQGSPARVLGAAVRLPGGRVIPGWDEAVGRLDGVAHRLAPAEGALMHGDVHLRNMLRRGDGSPVLIDPRQAWDETFELVDGVGDPAFDLGTLLHSLLPMSAVLRAVDAGRHEDLLERGPTLSDGIVDVTGLALDLRVEGSLADLEADLVAALADPREGVGRARLAVAAASALAGWLKYPDALRSAEAWWAVYVATVWYLDRGCGLAGGEDA
ncbi:hypothetical protein [Antribacter gilvus]|uniref:hypothetical protein n=1 Tax=Antribacter gilvus TaxID=2304675 RepID=UPI000F76C820|nr:hypothetical protein [Antribacter gilvus]